MPTTPSARKRSARYTAIGRYLMIALCLMALPSCSTRPSGPRIPAPPANLAADCPLLPNLPVPLIDPARLLWEAQVVAVYADCKARHRATVQAWPKLED